MSTDNENVSLTNKIIGSIKSTVESSSIHAIPNIVRTKYISLKAIWFFCFLVSSAGCVYFMVQSVLDYLTWPVVTNIDVNHVQELIFPIVTICNLNQFSSLITTNVVKYCTFRQTGVNISEGFEAILDPFYGQCLRFNNRKSMNGKGT